MTTFLRHRLWPAFALLLAMTVITGVIYPAVVTAVAQVAFPSQANGSLIVVDGRTVGSSLIGQAFNDPKYFWGRPSAAGKDGYDASGSAGSNLGPTSQALIDRITADVDRVRAANGGGPVPVDLVTTSASGLDPDISPAGGRVPGGSSRCRSWNERGGRPGGRRAPHGAAAVGVPGAAAGQRPAAQPGPGRTAPVTDPERDALDVRPTADEMLARVRSEATDGRGRLRIYLGMAPGVGKTFRMLEEGHRRVARGTDLVVGFVEPHGRPHTIELLEGLEIVPRRRIEYRGVVIEEMDTDAVLERHPTVALIDELAHTNVPGSPRAKRWQDVEVIRDAGIHVVTTMNVQHLESVAEAVATITGVPVNERLPDEIVRSADEIELVDMSPHALRQRMRHGNVYPPDRAAIALERFFTEPNLTALRDLSLRFVAGQVDRELEDSVAERGLAVPPVTERVMALVDESPACRRAVRRAASLASALHASVLALVVQTSGVELSRDRQQDLQLNVDYAVDLGAEVIRGEATDFMKGLEEVLREQRITHLVVAYRPRRGLDRLGRSPLAERILDAVPGIEVHLVSEPPRR